MFDSIPFDPPFILKIQSPEGDRWVEVQADGSQVPCAAPAAMPMPSPAKPSPASPKVTMLNVPYAEKDEAKQLGARWDPKRKKWYVPQGVNAEPFSRWVLAEK